MRRQPGLRCLIAEERAWAAPGWRWALLFLEWLCRVPPTAPYPTAGLWGVMTTTTCPNQRHAVPFLRNSTGVLPPRPDILYPDGLALHSTPHTHLFPLSLRPMLH